MYDIIRIVFSKLWKALGVMCFNILKFSYMFFNIISVINSRFLFLCPFLF